MTGQASFMWYDYLIFVSTLVVSLGIGLYYAFSGGKQKTTKEYLMGNRNLGVIPVGFSMFMSYISAILVLGNTAEMYTRGGGLWWSSIGSCGAFILCCFVFVPLFFPLKITSSFQYLEMRYKSKAVKLTGTLLLMLSQILYMGIAMYSPATALESATGIPTWASVVATGFVATIYTTLGGMKAVVWTDVFQAVVMVGGLIAVLAVGSARAGGMAHVWSIVDQEGRFDNMFEFSADPTIRVTFWSTVIGRVIASSQTVGTGQTSVQRYCALPTINKARMSVLLNVPAMIFLWTLTMLCGMVVFAFYHERGCDPLRTGEIANSNQLLPYFITAGLQVPALPGLFVAVLFSGALSTLSSSLNSLSAVTWKDILEIKFKHIPEERKSLATKILVAIFGAIAVGMAFMAQILGGHVLQASQSFVSGVAGPLLGVFILGSFFPHSNWLGAVIGAWTGLIFTMVITVGSYILQPHRSVLPTAVYNCSSLGYFNITTPADDPEGINPLFRLSFMWFPAVGSGTCVIVGLIISFISGPDDPKQIPPQLIRPYFDTLWCCLPKSVTRKCWCGVDHDSVEYTEEGYVVGAGEEDEAPSSSKIMDGLEVDTKHDNSVTMEMTVGLDDEKPGKERKQGVVNQGFTQADHTNEKMIVDDSGTKEVRNGPTSNHLIDKSTLDGTENKAFTPVEEPEGITSVKL